MTMKSSASSLLVSHYPQAQEKSQQRVAKSKTKKIATKSKAQIMLRKLVCVLLLASASGFVSPSAESCRRSQHVLGMSSDGPFELSVSLPGPGRNEMFGEEKKMHSVKLSM